jgi:NAD(P)H-dependent FMN reductase
MQGRVERDTMSESIRLGVIWGSLRKDSLNKKLAHFAVSGLDGVDVDHIDLAELDLALYSEDIENKGFPDNVLELKKRMIACDVLIFAAPEYNGSMSGALKNAIDWASRPRDGEAMLACFAGKSAGLLAASPGALGGIRGLRHLRQVLSQIQMHVVPKEFALSKAHEAFDDDGNMKDDKAASMVRGVVDQAVTVARAIKAHGG